LVQQSAIWRELQREKNNTSWLLREHTNLLGMKNTAQLQIHLKKYLMCKIEHLGRDTAIKTYQAHIMSI